MRHKNSSILDCKNLNNLINAKIYSLFKKNFYINPCIAGDLEICFVAIGM